MTAAAKPPGRRAAGFALVIVLWSVALLALLTSTLTSTARVRLRLAETTRDRAVAEAAADGAVRHAIFLLAEGTWRGATEQPLRLRVAGSTAEVVAEDQSARINPNMSTMPALRGLLSAIGVDAARAAALAGEIVDWRTRGQNSVSGGAKIDPYRRLGLPYREADHPFDAVDEIGMVADMTPAIAARLRPWLTVHQDGGPRTTDTASPVAAALEIQSVSASAPDANLPPARDRILRLTATVVSRGGARFVRSVIVRLRDADGERFRVLAWH